MGFLPLAVEASLLFESLSPYEVPFDLFVSPRDWSHVASYSVKKLKLPKCWGSIAWGYLKGVWFSDEGAGSTEPLQHPQGRLHK